MTTLSQWVNPTTGAVRVYFSDFCSSGQKVWAEGCAADGFGFDYTIVCINQNRSRTERENTVNDAERALFTLAQSRVKAFTQVIALAA
jgi:hypothetical protein